MANREDNQFVDRRETYMTSPQKEKISKNKTTVLLAQNTSQSSSEVTSETVSGESPRKRRVSSTSWQVKKTTEITDEVKTGQKVTTMAFEVDQSGSISPGVESEKHSFVTSTQFNVGSQKESGKRVFGTNDNESVEGQDSSDEFVFIENEDLGYVDRTEITEVHEEQESVAPEAKKSYFAYLLDQNQASESGKATQSPEKTSANKVVETDQKKKDDATMYERITYTPGLAIRSYAVEEMMQKKTSNDSQERTCEDAENNNMEAGAAAAAASERLSKSDSQNNGLLSPSESYRISQIVAVQETELWEEERLKKEREEYSIIDTLTMDDMMKMLGEHDRMKFEAQVANEEVFPIIPDLSSDNKYSETDSRLVSTESREQANIASDDKSMNRKETKDIKYSETSPDISRTLAEDKTFEIIKKGSNESVWSSTEITKSENSDAMSDPSEAAESTDTRYSEMSQRIEQIKTTTTSVEQTQSHVTDSATVTGAIIDNCQTETAIPSHDHSSRTATQEFKTQIKSFSDADQSISMGICLEKSATSLEGGVSIITAEKQSVYAQQQVKDETIPIPVEVERKFNITVNTETKINNLGGKLADEKSFVDIYYDDSDYTLTLSDCWLRKRDNKWEMKVAANTMSSQDFSTQYKEITSEKEIVNYLKNSLKLSSNSSLLNEILSTGDLTEFATISTTRKSYELSNCTIDLDLTDHGFQVGEIEVMAPSAAEVPAALKTIEDVARKLGLDMNKKIHGKMTDYLRRNNQRLYRLLVNSCVLVPVLLESEEDGVT